VTWDGSDDLSELNDRAVRFRFELKKGSLYSFWVSLFDLKLTRPHRVPFVWFENYEEVFQDDLFWQSVWRTTSFTVMCVAAIMLIALAMALLLNEEFRGRRFLSAMLLVPWAIPYVANGLMWKWIYDPSYGLLCGLHQSRYGDTWEHDRVTATRVFIVRINASQSAAVQHMSASHVRWGLDDLKSRRREIHPEGVVLIATGFVEGWLPDGPISLY
jgi:hypothetical protein